MKVNFTKYNVPGNDDTCVGFCFFRPVEYKKPLINLDLFVFDLKNSGIPYFCIEMLYDGQSSVLSDPLKVVRSKSVIFSKENLWNILERSIPEKYSKLIFLDCDVRFTNPDWFNISSDLLGRHLVIQPMDFTYRDIKGDSSTYEIDESDKAMFKPSVAKGVVDGAKLHSSTHNPGIGLGIDREFFRSIGGMYELGLNGPGDSLFWSCFCELHSRVVDRFDRSDDYARYKKRVVAAASSSKNPVSCVADNVSLHMYHGSMINRKYGKRDMYLPDNYELFHNEDGVLEIRSDRDLVQYWIDRKEDE